MFFLLADHCGSFETKTDNDNERVVAWLAEEVFDVAVRLYLCCEYVSRASNTTHRFVVTPLKTESASRSHDSRLLLDVVQRPVLAEQTLPAV